jgi:hypothetical protein
MRTPLTSMGIWHTHLATTLDGGKTYATVYASSTDPVQVGSICNLDTTGCMRNAVGEGDRNMLDFMDLSIDSERCSVAAFVHGCVVGGCDAGSPPSASRSALGRVIRQSSGPRLFAAGAAKRASTRFCSSITRRNLANLECSGWRWLLAMVVENLSKSSLLCRQR